GLNFNPLEVMANVDHMQCNLVLCHNPDVCDLDVWHGYNSWILAGHTHGGQVKPPFLDPFILPVKNKRYTSGEFAFEDGRTLYINRALGHLHQIRFNARREITLFEFASSAE
ncbi:MAG: phosphoesterase, partial [Flavobacteriales bacterium]